jgi:hypothetical protein
MNIGSATMSSPINAVRQAAQQPVNPEMNPAEREQDSDRDDSVLNVQPAQAKPVPAAVGKGIGLLVDISY